MWANLTETPPDVIFGMNQLFVKDTEKDKVSLIIGAYRDEDGKPYVFNVVRKVEEELFRAGTNKEYLPLAGYGEFMEGAKKLVFGDDPKLLERVATNQSLSGTGALRIGGELLYISMPPETKIYISKPTWENHVGIFKQAGLTNQEFYPYYNAASNSLDFEGMMEVLNKAEPNSIVLLHGCAHNPTGIDPTKEQWKEIAKLCKSKPLLPFIDLAYQGFATGDIEDDAYAVRLFAAEGLQFLVAESFAKNAGLYGERIGAIHVVCNDTDTANKVFTNMRTRNRAMFSNAPCHGAYIMTKIFKNPEYMKEWQEELKKVSGRIQKMRKVLFDELVALKTPGNWEHILNQIGMFSFTGLTEEQCEHMIEKHHVYLLKNGRVSMAGINEHNVKKVANAIHDAVISKPKSH